MISIIFSTFNEIEIGFFERSLKLLSKFKSNVEIICVDKHSTDGTIELAKTYGANVIKSNSNSRATRQNVGIENANGDMILLHHPRSLLSEEGVLYLIENQKNLTWGGFTHRFDLNKPLLNFTSWYSNNVRGRIREILYLDHCIYAKRDYLNKVGGVPELDIFEDTVLSQNLAKISAPKIIPFPSTTSSIRFTTNGLWKQAFLNQYLKIVFLTNGDHLKMNRLYEEKLNLNSKY